jgi:hypothetical protein
MSLGVVFLDRVTDICLFSYEVSILFSKVIALAFIPTSSVWVFFPASLSTFVFGGVLEDSYSSRSEVVS